MDWEKELIEWAKMDKNYQNMLEETKLREEKFLEIRDTLSLEHCDIIDSYISACEELDHILTGIAYQLGREK